MLCIRIILATSFVNLLRTLKWTDASSYTGHRDLLNLHFFFLRKARSVQKCFHTTFLIINHSEHCDVFSMNGPAVT